MKTLRALLEQEIKTVINEAVKIKFKGHTFVLKVDVNEDPNKKGIKVQFIPTTFGQLTPTEQNDIAISLGEKLDNGLSPLGIRIERDRNLKDKTVIGFFIYIEYMDKIIRQALSSQQATPDNDPSEEI
jgi:hypothetical protein